MTQPSSARAVRNGKTAFSWGDVAEQQIAVAYQAKGAKIIGRRVRNAGWEIDLVAMHQGMIVFVEVRARRTLEAARSSVTAQKLQRLISAAECYLAEHGDLHAPCRLDVAVIDRFGRFEVIENVTQH